ncbi:MAG: hypothetical protein WC803_05505 [Sphingomonas sp.]|jgi:hypothetical protein
MRIVTHHEHLMANWRMVMFGIGKLFLSLEEQLSRASGMSPNELLIYVTVNVANVQKLMRERNIPREFFAADTLPREWVVPISRNAIASATGLPRETVRRQVARMIERGLLMEDERGGVTPPVGVLQSLAVAPMLESLMTEFARTTEALMRAGVLEAKAN